MQKPKQGFYYHYKHDESGPINDYAYEVLGVSIHTENGEYSVVYRPLYETEFTKGVEFCNRPLSMFLEELEKDGKKTKRFTEVTDQNVLEKLRELRNQMYYNNGDK